MRCKVGDLAIVVGRPQMRSTAQQHLGKIVTVTAWAGPSRAGNYAWRTDPVLKHSDNGDEILWSDESLRPIRPQPSGAADEMLQLIGYPRPVVNVRK